MRIKTGLALALAGALSFGAAMATTQKRMELPDMVNSAAVAVLGEVASSKVAETPNGTVTLTEVRVIEDLWGAKGSDSLTVATMGGSKKIGKLQVGINVPGSPKLFSGQRVLLFLNKDNASAAAYSIVGFDQGMINVASSAKGSQLKLPGAAEATSWVDTARKLREMKTSAAPAAERLAR